MFDVEGFRSDAKGTTWLSYYGNAGDPRRWAPTEVADREMRKMATRINGLSGDKTLNSQRVRQILQKHEARLKFSPYTADPSDAAEVAECKAMYDFVDAFTVGGAAHDNIDNNGNSYADEHGTMDFDLGVPTDLEENNPGGAWLVERSNCWPAYGRINVNTAPREILENCLMAPNDTVRRELGTAIFIARSDDGQHGEASPANSHYRPFKSLGDLYSRVSVLVGVAGGFDRFGFDGYDNFSGSDANGTIHAERKLPDMAPDPYHLIDDLDERNYLWRINSEIITLRSDTFAAYLRIQARRVVSGTQKIVAERRVYEVWDRANCLWPPKRRDGRLHPDFVPPQRIGIQVFGY